MPSRPARVARTGVFLSLPVESLAALLIKQCSVEAPKDKKAKKDKKEKKDKGNRPKKNKKQATKKKGLKNKSKDKEETEQEKAEKERIKKVKQEANKARTTEANPELNASSAILSQVISSLSKLIRDTNSKISELAGMFRAKQTCADQTII